jgi:hypothetical protein
MFILPGCNKDSVTNIPISLTDKSGNVFIQIDTASKSFDAYSNTKITKGQLTGIFNDTIQSSFYLGLTTTPFWDTIYHRADTTTFPTHYTGETIVVQATVDLTNYTSPYHFLLLGLDSKELRVSSSGKPSIRVTITPSD